MTEIMPVPPPRTPRSFARAMPPDTAVQAAKKLEATFLAEMLKSAGFGQGNSFAGGIGEEQFASFQRQALADEMVRSGGIGLAEMFFQSMMEAGNDPQ